METIKDITNLRDQMGTSSLLNAIASNTQPFHSKNGKVPAETVKLPAIVNARDLVNRPLNKPPELIKGLLHQGSKMVLGGGSKTFKSWTLIEQSICVANGQPWWGFETVQTKVLYINLELADWSFASRMNEITTARPELSNLDEVDVWNLRGYATSLDVLSQQFIERAGNKYGLIIIDPIYKVYGGRDENSAGDMGELLNVIESIAVKTNAAVVFGAHFSKGNQAGKESIDRISGSGVFARDPDTILVMTKHEQADTYTVEATLRNLKPIDPFCVQRNHPLMERNEQLDPKKLKQASAKVEQFPVALLLQSLGVEELTNKEWEKKTCAATGMSERTFQLKLGKIKDDPKYVTKTAEGKWKATSPIYPPDWRFRDKGEGKEALQ